MKSEKLSLTLQSWTDIAWWNLCFIGVLSVSERFFLSDAACFVGFWKEMDNWLLNNILTFALAIFVVGALIPQILIISYRKKLFDNHDERKVHVGAVPRLGGVAFVPGLFSQWCSFSGYASNSMRLMSRRSCIRARWVCSSCFARWCFFTCLALLMILWR